MLQTRKITSIEKIDEKESYDLIVPGNNNFFLKNGILSHNCSAYQSWNDVPDKILSNTRFIFVPRSADVGTLKSVLTNVGVVKNVQSSVNKAIRLKRAMEKKPFSWIIFDRMNASYDLIESLSPLSEHMESTQ